MDHKKEREFQETDALTNVQVEQTKGITGIFYKMYIDDSRRFAARFKGKVILDIGAGDGIILRGSGIEPVEMDVALERCKRLAGLQKKVLCGSAFELPVKNDSVDCVLLIAVLEHTSNPGRVLDEICRVLKKGGEVAILVPNDISMSIGRVLLLKFPPRYPGHISFITPARIKKWLGGRFDIARDYNLPFKGLSFWLSMYHFVYIRKK
ncbi:class I SAM-dependent methyltransferase [bacterium]|nr:MAG: class I SAM-dependent methyltransferase [bacterium]